MIAVQHSPGRFLVLCIGLVALVLIVFVLLALAAERRRRGETRSAWDGVGRSSSRAASEPRALVPVRGRAVAGRPGVTPGAAPPARRSPGSRSHATYPARSGIGDLRERRHA